MFYFDKEFLLQYLQNYDDLKVVVPGNVISVPSDQDLTGNLRGIGYDEYGTPREFTYKSIQAIIVDDTFKFTIDDLNAYKTGKKSKPEKGKNDSESSGDTDFEADLGGGASIPSPGEGEEGGGGSQGGIVPPPGEEDEEKPKTPQEAWERIGKKIMRESFRNKNGLVNRFVRNIDPHCEKYNTGGVIIEDAGDYLTYRVYTGPFAGAYVTKHKKELLIV